MLVVGNKILEQNFLDGAEKSNLCSGGYYLRINSIIPYSDALLEDQRVTPRRNYILAPGEAAWIVSEEIFNIRNYAVTALVTLRSTFTKKGMMALDVGLVDAGYHGPIGTVVINISKNNIRLAKGETFFRVIFMEHDMVEEEFRFPPRCYDHESYIKERVTEIVRDFPGTFLQMGDIEQKLTEKFTNGTMTKELESSIVNAVVVGILKRHAMKLISAAAIVVASTTLVLAKVPWQSLFDKILN